MLRGIFLRRKDKAGLPLITNGLGLFTLCRTLFLIAKASYNIFSFCGASSGNSIKLLLRRTLVRLEQH